MRQLKSILITTMVAATIGGLIFVSCKKDKDLLNTSTTTPSSVQQDNGKELFNKIQKFLDMCDAYKTGIKSDEVMTLADAREILDLTINYEYSEHQTVCYETTLDTLSIPMPQADNNGNVSANDVVATYNTFGTTLSSLAAGINDDMDVFSYFSIKFPETGAKDNDIEVVFTRGEQPNDTVQPYPGPFVEGNDYYWGKRLGRCDGDSTVRITDATLELSRKFKFVSNPPGLMVISEVEYENHEASERYNTESCSIYWLFFERTCNDDYEPCIDSAEMNCYWRSIIRDVVRETGCFHYSQENHIPYHECSIVAKERQDGGCLIKEHIAWITYANIYYFENE